MFELPEYITLAGQINETLTGKAIKKGYPGNSPHKFVWYNWKALPRMRVRNRKDPVFGRSLLFLSWLPKTELIDFRRCIMKFSASLDNREGFHQVTLKTGEKAHSISIPPRSSGFGSSANGGELLFLALATCYCNDIYREAEKRGLEVTRVEVDVEGDFGAPGEPATNVSYRAKITARGSHEETLALMRHTDTVAEIQNTLRANTPVTLNHVEAVKE
jgi:organic hydroperoxide reductase OsmC/OhrA